MKTTIEKLAEFHQWMGELCNAAHDHQQQYPNDPNNSFYEGQFGVLANAMVNLRDKFPAIQWDGKETTIKEPIPF